MRKTVKKFIRPPFELAGEFVKEAKKQIKAKAPAPEELLSGGGVSPGGQPPRQKIQKDEEAALGQVRMEKAKMLGEWRRRYQQIQGEILQASREREEKEKEAEKIEKIIEEKKEKEKQTSGGEEALASTGASQKRPTGLWGIGQRFKKMFKWFTPERKGRSPR